MKFVPKNGRLLIEEIKEEKEDSVEDKLGFLEDLVPSFPTGAKPVLYKVLDASHDCMSPEYCPGSNYSSDWIGKTIAVDMVFTYVINGEVFTTCLASNVAGVIEDETED